MHFHTLLPVVGLALFQAGSAASIRRSTPVVSSNLPDGYNYLGCFVDSVQNRQLAGASYSSSTAMTEESCINFCYTNGYQEAGLEYGAECYCGHQFQNQPQQVADSQCNQACSGNSSEVCGAANRLSVFSNGKAAPVTNPGTGGYTLLGCYNDTVSARALPNGVNAGGSTGNSVESCISTCKGDGYAYAGVEYGSECFCGSAILNNAVIEPSGCDITCPGNASEYCGGSNRIDIYHANSAHYSMTSSKPLPTTTQSLTKTSAAPVTTSSTPVSTSATSTASTCTATSTSTSPYLSNGGFENGLTGWTTQAYQGTFSAQVKSDGLSYQGCKELSVVPTSNAQGNRQFALSTTLTNLNPNTRYTVSIAIGQPTSAISTSSAPYLAITGSSGQQIGGGYICGYSNTDACTSPGNGGSVYGLQSASFQAPAEGMPLGFVISWIGQNVGNSVVLVDAVTVSQS